MGVELVFNSVEFGVPGSCQQTPRELETRCGREGHTRPRGHSESPDGVDPNIRRTIKTQRDGHYSGVKISSILSHATLQQPFRTLAIKWEVNIFLKKSSCVFLLRLPWCEVYHCVSIYPVYICMQQTDISLGLLQVFVELGNLHGTSNYVLYWNHGVACSDSVGHNRVKVLSILYFYSPAVRIETATSRWLSPMKLREPTPITITPCFQDEFYKHMKKAGGYIGRNVLKITIKMKTIDRKPFMIKINNLRLRNLDNGLICFRRLYTHKTIWLMPREIYYHKDNYSIRGSFNK